MYIVKATDHTGSVSFACGTSDQVLDKLDELASRGFKNVTIRDPGGKEWTAAAFIQSH